MFQIGAFGSGAAFAMQDSWILAQAIEHTRARGEPLLSALEIFDGIRSPYYKRMFVIPSRKSLEINYADVYHGLGTIILMGKRRRCKI